MHINELELKAIYFGLLSFCSEISDVHIRIRSDNITAVTYINNLGGVRSIKCHKLTKQIWSWAINNNIHLSAEHLPGSENVLADTASRIFDENTEWSLDSHVYSIIVEQLGPFCIDLFASRLNYKESKYVSWKPDPLALFVDAFSRSWNDFNKFYAFPPFSLILSCIQKITTDKARGVLIIPLWPTQPWFPKILGMLVAVPLLLPKNVLNLPFRPMQTHTLNNSLHLLACPLSGIISETKAFQNNLSISCATLGELPQLSNTKSIIKSGILSVIAGKQIPVNIMKH